MAEQENELNRRDFIGSVVKGAAGGAIAASVLTTGSVNAQPEQTEVGIPERLRTNNPLFRAEMDVHDCEVEGKIPDDLSGAFYRVGPDSQYGFAPGNIPFDGEGHASMFRIKNGRADFRSRFIRNERYLAQDEAGRNLFPIYRNPSMDDPSVAGLSRSTANTHVINHKNMLLALKEDSPPTALDLLTLETVVPTFTFDDQLPSQTFTAHPKIDSETGNMVAFGYEAEGHGSDVVSLFEFTPDGKKVWDVKIKVPYVSLIHDFAVTQNFIVLFLMPLTIDYEQMARGGIHWSWDGTRPSYLGYIRRGGDGSDLKWIEGPTRGMYHVMGAFDDNQKVYVDMSIAKGNQLPFMPQKDNSPWDPRLGMSNITRVSSDHTRSSPRDYGMEVMYPQVFGDLPRQDDRYNTMPYRYGFQPCADPYASAGERAGACYAGYDHSNGKVSIFNAGVNTTLAECCFAPKSASAAEGEGYLVGVATRHDENNRADLIILDAQHIEDGPVAVVKLPLPIVGQVHGWWVREDQMPTA